MLPTADVWKELVSCRGDGGALPGVMAALPSAPGVRARAAGVPSGGTFSRVVPAAEAESAGLAP